MWQKCSLETYFLLLYIHTSHFWGHLEFSNTSTFTRIFLSEECLYFCRLLSLVQTKKRTLKIFHLEMDYPKHYPKSIQNAVKAYQNRKNSLKQYNSWIGIPTAWTSTLLKWYEIILTENALKVSLCLKKSFGMSFKRTTPVDYRRPQESLPEFS